jgi:succinyl-CoA synthetase alpha subunit
VTCHIHHLGGGVSQALGTGGRDLHGEIGGITMLQGLAALAADPNTRVIVLISKPPGTGDRAPHRAAGRRGRTSRW